MSDIFPESLAFFFHHRPVVFHLKLFFSFINLRGIVRNLECAVDFVCQSPLVGSVSCTHIHTHVPAKFGEGEPFLALQLPMSPVGSCCSHDTTRPKVPVMKRSARCWRS